MNFKSTQLLLLILLTIKLIDSPLVLAGKQTPTNKNIEEVIVTQTQDVSSLTLQTEKLIKIPGTLGDPIQAVFSLPGVLQVNDDESSPAVRGSSPSANDFIVDYLPVGYLFHDFGNSIFNENLIRDFDLYAAGFGAKYANATGAVFDISLRRPRNQPLTTTIDLSLLRAGVMFEGGVTENQSFYFSYREGLIQFFLDKEELKNEDDINIHDMPLARDYQGKYFWNFGTSTLTFSVTGAQDAASADFGETAKDVLLDPGMEGKAVIDETFHSQSLLWHRTQKSYHNKVALGHLMSIIDNKVGRNEFVEIIFDRWIMKAEHGQIVNGSHYVTVGVDLQNRRYDYDFNIRFNPCTDFNPSCAHTRGDLTFDKRKKIINTYDGFIEDRWELSDVLALTGGIHMASDDYLEEYFIEPRVALSWQFFSDWKISGSMGKYHQLPEVDEILPIIGNPRLKSPTATHYVFGVNNELGNGWSWKADIYYKDINKLSLDTEDETLPYINAVEGSAYGLELMINKSLTDRWYGWFALSMSKTERTNNITGQTTDSFYDVPLVANLVFNYQINRLWDVGFRWSLRDGSLYTPVINNRENPDFPGHYLPVYGELNSKRDKTYHRLDFRVERVFNNNAFDGSFYIDIINLYNRNNSYNVKYEAIADTRDYKLVREQGYGIFPSIGIKFIF